HVEIYQGIAELDVPSLAARLRTQKDSRMIPKRGDRSVLLRPAETSVESRKRKAWLFETGGEVSERLARMDENKLLLGRIATNEVDQRGLFAAGFDRRPLFGEFSPNRVAGVSRCNPSERRRSGARRGPGRAQDMLEG